MQDNLERLLERHPAPQMSPHTRVTILHLHQQKYLNGGSTLVFPTASILGKGSFYSLVLDHFLHNKRALEREGIFERRGQA